MPDKKKKQDVNLPLDEARGMGALLAPSMGISVPPAAPMMGFGAPSLKDLSLLPVIYSNKGAAPPDINLPLAGSVYDKLPASSREVHKRLTGMGVIPFLGNK